jgi:hypothetical protein
VVGLPSKYEGATKTRQGGDHILKGPYFSGVLQRIRDGVDLMLELCQVDLVEGSLIPYERHNSATHSHHSKQYPDDGIPTQKHERGRRSVFCVFFQLQIVDVWVCILYERNTPRL